jgi:triacylglycerol lipase
MENSKPNLTSIRKDSEAIILLHGLARTSRCMNKAGSILRAYGYKIINVNYPSRRYDIPHLALSTIDQALSECDATGVSKIHFLTHSMGGILLRYYLSVEPIDKLGYAVMLAPPNQGSEIVDKLAGWPLFYWLNGPAGRQLGTNNSSLPIRLGKVTFAAGIIAGNKSINPLLSLLIGESNDGKVSVNRAQVEGMQDFIVMPYSHTFIMQRVPVIEQALYFIQHGNFTK